MDKISKQKRKILNLMNNQVIQIKSTSIMTQWKSLGKNGKEDEQQKNGSANTLKQHGLSKCS